MKFDLPELPNLRTIKMQRQDKTLLTSALKDLFKGRIPPGETRARFDASLESMRIVMVDLNGDGTPEVIAQGTDNDFCGHSGICGLFAFRREPDKYVPILEGTALTFTVKKTRTNSYRDIVAEYQYSANTIEYHLYRLNKVRYAETKCWRSIGSEKLNSNLTIRPCK
jgi:hypothetical protein